ncbi:hypothetical protein P3T73_11465 [Kiritimatiellota bacterium B12222]|nr:hypothetical protein P3T73_11465 [Kiritimatiellota bacterium B12222]
MNPLPSRFKKLLGLLPFSILIFGPLFAQNAEEPATLHLRVLMFNHGGPEHIYTYGVDELETIRLSSVQPSPPVEVKANNPLPLYYTAPDPESETVPRPHAGVKIPAGIQHVLILGKVQNDKVSWVAIPDNLPLADSRDWQMINASPVPIVIRIGEESEAILLKPGSQKVYKLNVKPGEGAAVTAARWVDGEPEIFYSTYWPVKENQRGLVLFLSEGGGVQVKRISERLPPS